MKAIICFIVVLTFCTKLIQSKFHTKLNITLSLSKNIFNEIESIGNGN